MKKLILIVLLCALGASAIASEKVMLSNRTKTVRVKVAVPEFAKYRTTDAAGAIELWSQKPFVITTDDGKQFWASERGIFVGRIVGGIAPKHDWRRSARRVR